MGCAAPVPLPEFNVVMSLMSAAFAKTTMPDNNAMHQTSREGVALAPVGGQSLRRALQVIASVSRIPTMKLIGQESEEFRLQVVGYEFPQTTEDEWDSEWLIVAGEVSCARGRWKFRDPCLLTLELEA